MGTLSFRSSSNSLSVQSSKKPLVCFSSTPFFFSFPCKRLVSRTAQLIPSNDALDMVDFDCVDYINKLFPDVDSLSKLDPVMNNLKVMMVRTEEEILRQVRRQSLASAKGKRELDLAKESIEDLFAEIVAIKSKAEKSEQMVDDVCRDIKSLDFAKKNLTASITTLKRLNMLVTGVSQLKTMAAKRQYKEVGSLLQAVTSLSPCFEEFHYVDKIVEAKKQFDALKEECKNLVYTEFEGLDHHAPTPPYFSDLCSVVEALGKQSRLEFMSWFVKDRLLDYETSFKEGEEASKLENIKLRFQWLRRELQFYAEHFEKTFPASWEMPQLLCEEFCLVTKEKLAKILHDMKASGSLKVRALIDTMKTTIDFQNELNKRFTGGKSNDPAFVMDKSKTTERTPAQDQEMLMAEQLAKSNPFSPEALKLKWKKFQEEKSLHEGMVKEGLVAPCTRFNRIISAAFEPYLEIYVSFEDRELQQAMGRIKQSGDSFEDRNMVFESSQALFVQFKDVMDTCTSLSRGLAFLQISEIFRNYLKQYADYLMGKLPKQSEALKLKEGEEKTICFVINTAEYCTSNVEALADTIRQHIDEEYQGKVNMSVEQDRFQTLVARGMQALVRALETRIAPAFSKMQKLNWSAWDSVVQESEYVQMIEMEVRECSAIFHKWLSKSRFGFFCDSFANSFIPKLKESIYMCKFVSEVGAEQLLLDMAHIKGILDALPKQGQGDRVPARYKRIVTKDMSKIERVLKVLLTPKEGVVDSYLAMVAKGNQQELQKVLELKGIQKKDQVSLIERYMHLKTDSPSK